MKPSPHLFLMVALALECTPGCSTAPSAPAAKADVVQPSDLAEFGAAGTDTAPASPDATDAGAAAPDSAETNANAGDSAGVQDGEPAPTQDIQQMDASDVAPSTVCTPGTQTCQGIKLATCGTKGDGFIVTNCYPGMACVGGGCQPVPGNLVIVFDSSGSMDSAVVKKDGSKFCAVSASTWPICEYGAATFPPGCTRMGVSKSVFKQALAKLDDATTKMLLFRFPQKASTTTKPSCASGYYTGQDKLSGDLGVETVSATTNWFWDNLNETLCEPFPANSSAKTKAGILKWMDGIESKVPVDPELRPTGSTPIGKTLFYVGEYLRNRVIIDGQACTTDASCQNVNYVCQGGKCADAARSCRETVVILFTDGGETNSNSFFAPWVQAKRLSQGLGCTSSADCVGGTVCKTFQQCLTAGKPNGKFCSANTDCVSGTCSTTPQTQCMPEIEGTGYFCTDGGTPCQPDIKDPASPTFCDPAKGGQCVQDPRPMLTATAKDPPANVLRSPDGKPFGVRIHVVDISGAANVQASMGLALSGNGKLLGADASDPGQFLGVLDAAFDLKTKKVCGAQ